MATTHIGEKSPSQDGRPNNSGARRPALVIALIAMAIGASLVMAGPAFAGRAATGKLAFDPCTKCHPVYVDANGKPTKPLPGNMEKHQIELEVHDILGEGDKACLACHDDPTRNPGMVKLADSSLIPVTGDVSRVCQRCHFEKYREFTLGIHGKGEKKCSAQGCHDPHTPSWIYVPPLPPFLGTGLEVRAVGDKEPFTPLASPPLPAPVLTPRWLAVAAILGALYALGVIGYLVRGRLKR